eukprot:Gb_02757 [translate_table: standard]
MSVNQGGRGECCSNEGTCGSRWQIGSVKHLIVILIGITLCSHETIVSAHPEGQIVEIFGMLQLQTSIELSIRHLSTPWNLLTWTETLLPILPKWIPFHTLATSGQILLVDDTLKQGVDVNTVDKDGLTALHKAVLCKREAVVGRLLKRGADPNVRDKNSVMPKLGCGPVVPIQVGARLPDISDLHSAS